MKIYLALYRQGGTFDALIKWWTRTAYSHAALCYGQMHRKDLKIEALLTGVRQAKLEDYPGNWIIDCLELPDIPEDLHTEIWEEARKYLGRKYDFKGVLSFLWKYFRQNPEAFFCSELIETVLGKFGLNCCEKSPWKVIPADLASSSRTVKIKTLTKRGFDGY